MGGAIRQGRMVDTRDSRVIVQEFDHAQRILHVPLNAQRQGFHPLQEQECVKGRQYRAGIAQQHRPDTRAKCRRAACLGKRQAVITRVRSGQLRELARRAPVKTSALDDDTAECRAVAAQKFGGRVHYNICAVLDGPDQIGRAKGIVHHQRDAVAMGSRSRRLDVGYIAVWIAQGLDEDRPGIVADRVRKGLGQRVHEGRGDALPGQRMRQQVVCAAIDRALGHDVAAALHKVLQGIGDRGRARGERQGGSAALQRRSPRLECGHRGVGQPGVNIAGVAQGKPVRCLVERVEHIGRGLINRHSTGAGRRVRLLLSGV